MPAPLQPSRPPRATSGRRVAASALIALSIGLVVVVIAQQDDPAVAEAGEEAYEALANAGVDVIVDDRPVRAGVKFSDAELVGIPFRVTIGKRGLAAGTAELTERESGTTVQIPLADLVPHVREAIAKSLVANR